MFLIKDWWFQICRLFVVVRSQKHVKVCLYLALITGKGLFGYYGVVEASLDLGSHTTVKSVMFGVSDIFDSLISPGLLRNVGLKVSGFSFPPILAHYLSQL